MRGITIGSVFLVFLFESCGQPTIAPGCRWTCAFSFFNKCTAQENVASTGGGCWLGQKQQCCLITAKPTIKPTAKPTAPSTPTAKPTAKPTAPSTTTAKPTANLRSTIPTAKPTRERKPTNKPLT
jgi:hypothetical protein